MSREHEGGQGRGGTQPWQEREFWKAMACLGTEGLFVKTSERLQGSPLQPQAKLSPQSRTRAYRGAPLVLPPAPPPSRSWLPGSPISAILCRLLGVQGDEMPFSLVPLFLRMARREPRLSAPLRPFTGATLRSLLHPASSCSSVGKPCGAAQRAHSSPRAPASQSLHHRRLGQPLGPPPRHRWRLGPGLTWHLLLSTPLPA